MYCDYKEVNLAILGPQQNTFGITLNEKNINRISAGKQRLSI